MPDSIEKLERFKKLLLEDAAAERDEMLRQVEAERTRRISAAEAELKRKTQGEIQLRANTITAESGRALSRRLLADKRLIATRREEIAHEVFGAVREKILAFTQTQEYLPHLKKLYTEAFQALGSPYDGVLLLRREDMGYARELTQTLPGRHVQVQEGSFVLGGLIVDCHSKLLRADQSYDTALDELDGHFAELFGLSLADD